MAGAGDFFINGETLVRVKFAAHVSGTKVRELGLTVDSIILRPNFYHAPVHVDDFGPNCPAEIQWQLASMDIRMNLIHYEYGTMLRCWEEAMCGSDDGRLAPAGLTLGRGKRIFESGNHFVSLNLIGTADTWRFRTSYLATPPLEFPLTTQVSIAALQWRAIPYVPPMLMFEEHVLGGDGGNNDPFVLNAGGELPGLVRRGVEIVSSGAILFDRFPDVQ